jgi:hypothetical protein
MDLRANARVSTRVPLPYLARRLLRPAAEGRYGDLTKDLKINSDDLSFVFVPNLEKSLGIRVPTRAWDSIHCGRDTARLLEKLINADAKG